MSSTPVTCTSRCRSLPPALPPLLRGLASYIAGELHVDVAIAPDPLNCVARGTAISLSEGRYLTAGFRDATPKAWHKRLQNNHDPFAGE